MGEENLFSLLIKCIFLAAFQYFFFLVLIIDFILISFSENKTGACQDMSFSFSMYVDLRTINNICIEKQDKISKEEHQFLQWS